MCAEYRYMYMPHMTCVLNMDTLCMPQWMCVRHVHVPIHVCSTYACCEVHVPIHMMCADFVLCKCVHVLMLP